MEELLKESSFSHKPLDIARIDQYLLGADLFWLNPHEAMQSRETLGVGVNEYNEYNRNKTDQKGKMQIA